MKSQILHFAHQKVSQISRRVLDTLMPPLCPVTGELVGRPSLLSGAGWASLHFIEEPFCYLCGIPFAADYGDGVSCPACTASPPAFDSVRGAVVYDDASHKLIVGFKHSDRTELAPLFAKWLARAGGNILTAESIIIPIPLHPSRLLARRYNQSAMLASSLSKKTGASLSVNLLERVRATPPQKNLSAESRQRNVAGAFAVTKNAGDQIKGSHIVLVDDVITTGATLSACARTLKKAGAARVDGLIVAKVVKGGIGAI